ncbi:hypothetical protein [Sphingomonas sp. BK235]|uniref:hypothetical protein n=1 Tax=Sphingomonas sp. BK235 TaxID=2512131 RepID=UPI001050DD8D|nr:hypothetical protein [Sphingomonas sp. BK235]TCP35908.1 hypothetical protein EV292_102498 [Sphingomonas sp. BK235]
MATEDTGAGAGGGDALGGLLGGAGGGAGGGTAPAAEGGAGAGSEAGSGAPAGAAPDWYAHVSAEAGDGESASNRDWLAAKGFKDLDAVVKSARHAERALHDKGMVAVPKEGAAPEQVAAFHRAIGVPEAATGYEIKGPEGVALNEPLLARLAGAAHAAGVPKGAFERTVGEFIQAQLDEAAAERTRQDQLAEGKLKEWGGKKDEQLAHVSAGMRALGLSGADGVALRGALGADRALELMAKIGAGVAEDTLVGGGRGTFGVSAAEAKTQLDAMRNDPEVARKVASKGTPERARWERLNRAWAEGQ